MHYYTALVLLMNLELLTRYSLTIQLLSLSQLLSKLRLVRDLQCYYYGPREVSSDEPCFHQKFDFSNSVWKTRQIASRQFFFGSFWKQTSDFVRRCLVLSSFLSFSVFSSFRNQKLSVGRLVRIAITSSWHRQWTTRLWPPRIEPQNGFWLKVVKSRSILVI